MCLINTAIDNFDGLGLNAQYYLNFFYMNCAHVWRGKVLEQNRILFNFAFINVNILVHLMLHT